MSTQEELEKLVPFPLPEQYVEFLTRTNGGACRSDTFRISCGTEVMAHILFGFQRNRSLDLRFWHTEFGEDIPEGSLLIGCDPGGAFYLLLRDSDWGVWYYDHAYSMPQSSDDENTYAVDLTLDEFLELWERPFDTQQDGC
ncbi:MAG: hypothetical protein A3K19_04655 [Lentisphaerae bacterium RIFOXYB12_FULL_65_16]|nr:MAG: hypothetical protein A3K19_04655 [Lentisphaerae bacterium RIFOXYB12_FULL_65_16]